MLRAIRRPDAELSILLCDDESIRELNQRYRKKNQPTDVLAFPLGVPADPEKPAVILLGDIVISLETATRQARTRNVAIVDEVTFLLAHGLLHLLGFDHQTVPEWRRMMALTDGLLAASKSRR